MMKCYKTIAKCWSLTRYRNSILPSAINSTNETHSDNDCTSSLLDSQKDIENFIDFTEKSGRLKSHRSTWMVSMGSGSADSKIRGYGSTSHT